MLSISVNRRRQLQWLSSLLLVGCASAFLVPNPWTIAIAPSTSSSNTCLNLAKRRGNLGSLVDAGDSVSSSKKTRTAPKKRSKRVSNKKKNAAASNKKDDGASSTISPLLQEWASGQVEEDDNDEEDTATTTTPTTVSTGSAASFTSFEEDNNKKTKNTKQAKRAKKKTQQQAQDEQRQATVTSLVEQLESVLEASKEDNKKTADINDILQPIQQLINLPNPNTNLRQLIAGQKRIDYRLAWVGSDAAICHVGTGLHNVPLARLQEVYLSALGKSRLEVLEVIRIIGPFPNVRNTLEGSCKLGKRIEYDGDASLAKLAITYDSMIDGAGKQITAGMENNVRIFDLHVLFCDENAIVAVVPPSDEDDNGVVRENPLEANGANILFFAREQNLEENLDKLRVL